MEKQSSFGKYLENIVADIKNDVDLLYHGSSRHREDRLAHLRERVGALEDHINMINDTYDLSVNAVTLQVQNPVSETEQPTLPTQPAPSFTPVPERPAPGMQAPPIPMQPGTVPEAQNKEQTFTLEELALYNGRNGNPAYVCVNGMVYDVTGSSVWAAATHFGLTAGNDWSNEYNSCHAGENAIGNLPVIGTLAES